ncbi:hypothetical protein [Paenimyroides aestuarii]|uniref:Uncharacterized protein n=1 Tax=Paenimyroides aestuarii TaxID=2968490 RepID=A0ABY5NT16_9FLAO|nr:hypothetical protein [Paenimyroides aestuarii]UUV21711.1 hypothetical protein NPX36_01270 [Paenimyroides aestuarii]
MKKTIFILSLGLFTLATNAQVTVQTGGNNLTFRRSADFNDAAVAGSKYIQKSFESAKVNNGTQNFPIRYNAYADVMEYKDGSDILELIKEKNTHFVFEDGSVYELLQYTDDKNSYSRYHKILMDQNNVKVSKFQSVKLNPATKASNSYESDSQAFYKQNNDLYYITYNNQTFEFDGKQKTLDKNIEGKSAEIKKFYKENKIKENDADMIKLGHFLATL